MGRRGRLTRACLRLVSWCNHIAASASDRKLQEIRTAAAEESLQRLNALCWWSCGCRVGGSWFVWEVGGARRPENRRLSVRFQVLDRSVTMTFHFLATTCITISLTRRRRHACRLISFLGDQIDELQLISLKTSCLLAIAPSIRPSVHVRFEIHSPSVPSDANERFCVGVKRAHSPAVSPRTPLWTRFQDVTDYW